MNKMSKKLLSLLVAFSMIISMFAMTSVTAFAAENVPQTVTLVAYPKAAPEGFQLKNKQCFCCFCKTDKIYLWFSDILHDFTGAEKSGNSNGITEM